MSITFQYHARDTLGQEIHGTIEAIDADEAKQQLLRDGLHPIGITEENTGAIGLFAPRVKKTDIMFVTTQLAVMVDTGISLAKALDAILEQEQNETMKRILLDLKSSVEAGEDFSSALERHPRYFDHTYVAMVRASEATGTLGEMLDRIAGYLRKQLDLKNRVRAALAYPMIMMVIATAVTFFLLTFIVPKFLPMFEQQGKSLPKLTVVLMVASTLLRGYWYAWIVGGVALTLGFIYGKRTEPGRIAWDWVRINAPVAGPLLRKVTLSRSIHTLGTMVSSGVSVLEAIQLSSDVSNNFFFQRDWDKALEKVTSGSHIHDALSTCPLFPATLVQMIRAGEESGRLDQVLMRVSSFYDDEVDASVKTTTSMLEPLMISVMGVVVGSIGLGLLLPIFSLSRGSG